MNRGEPICRYFANGACSRGTNCRYLHDRTAPDQNNCQFYSQGICSFGDRCRFYHAPRPREVRRQSNAMRHPRPNANLIADRRPQQVFNVNAPEFIPRAKTTEGPSGLEMSSRPLCPYFEANGKCENARSKCQLVHGELCDMCNTYCLHPFNETARKQHLKDCVKKIEEAMEFAFIEKKSQDKSCGICMEPIYETNLRFGILNGCKHCFCLECIRQWRSNNVNPDLETKVIRSCPECRQHSDYVIPSIFWLEDEVEKKLLIQMYKENTKSKVCKYYNSPQTRGDCPFGNQCFYKHQLPDGSIDPGESPYSRKKPKLSEWFDMITRHDDDEEEDAELVRMFIRAQLGENGF